MDEQIHSSDGELPVFSPRIDRVFRRVCESADVVFALGCGIHFVSSFDSLSTMGKVGIAGPILVSAGIRAAFFLEKRYKEEYRYIVQAKKLTKTQPVRKLTEKL